MNLPQHDFPSSALVTAGGVSTAMLENMVETLHREAIGSHALPADLPPGGWRWLEAADLQQLEQPWPSARS